MSIGKSWEMTSNDRRDRAAELFQRAVRLMRDARRVNDGLECDSLISEVIEESEFIVKKLKEFRT